MHTQAHARIHTISLSFPNTHTHTNNIANGAKLTEAEQKLHTWVKKKKREERKKSQPLFINT